MPPVSVEHVFAEVLVHLRLHAHRGVQAVERMAPALARVLCHAVAAHGRCVFVRIQPGELLVQIFHPVGESLRLSHQAFDGRQRRAQAIDRVVVQSIQIACLVDQHLRFVLKLPHLVVDLLQRADRGQRVLHQIGRVNYGPLRLRGRQRAEQHGGNGREKCLLHDGFSCEGLDAAGADGSRSAAQSRPQWRSHAPAKPATPASSNMRSMSR